MDNALPFNHMFGSVRSTFRKIPASSVILAVVFIVYISYFLFLSFSRHNNYRSLRLDLGNMDQTVWNVYKGNGFVLTDPEGEQQESRIAIHADFLLILLAPLYVLWSDPRMLLIVQTIAVGLGMFPVYLLAKDKTQSRFIGLFFTLLYVINPALHRLLLHDFHAVTLVTPLLLWAFWFLHKERMVPFILCLFFAALGKEDIWLVTGLLGIYTARKKKHRVLGSIVALVSFSMFYLLFWKVIPSLTPDRQHFALSYLSEFGGSLNGIVKNLLKNPFGILPILIAPDRLWYYFQLLIPIGFLSIFSPLFLIFSAPALGVNILSSNGNMRMIDYQYTSAITPFLFISAIFGFSVFRQFVKKHIKKQKDRKRITAVILVGVFSCALYATYQWGEFPFSPTSRFKTFTTVPHHKGLMDWVKYNIPQSASVSTTNNLGAHYSQRKILYNFPVGATKADYSVVLLGDFYAWPSSEAQQATVDALLTDTGYELFAHDDNFYAFKKKE